MKLPIVANDNGGFRCSKLSCSISVASCAARYRRASLGRVLTTSGSNVPDSLEICRRCSTGAENAGVSGG